VEASTIPATAVLAPQRARASTAPLLRLRSDEQLVRLFRGGNEEAFRVIHDRYRARLHAYARQMLAGCTQDAEDALQDVWIRAYGALRADDREVSLRAWLYRVAHNRCIDELRRPVPPAPEAFELVRPPASDPSATTEQRESLRRLVQDIQRLPDQQRSALLMREIVGMSYQDLAVALDVTVPAVKSLLVRARIGLAEACEARDTACVEIRSDLADAYERGVRASGLARRHLHDCADCRAYRHELRATQRRIAALAPALGPGTLLAKLLGIGGGGAAASGGAGAGGGAGAAAAGVTVGGGSIGLSAGHVAAVVAVAVVGAGGAVEVQQTIAPAAQHHAARPPAIVRGHPAQLHIAAPLVPQSAAPVDPRTRHPAAALRLRLVPPAPTPAPTSVPPPSATPAPTGATDPSNGGAAAPGDFANPPPPLSNTSTDGTTADGTAPTDSTSSTDGSTTSSSSSPDAATTATSDPQASAATGTSDPSSSTNGTTTTAPAGAATPASSAP
jgi:RNA polymerase sigma factor (sigma-70 family)